MLPHPRLTPAPTLSPFSPFSTHQTRCPHLPSSYSIPRMLSAGHLIWISCRPLFRLIICVGCGFAITKADIFPPVAARGTGQILLNITLPSLMFSKIVPAFTSQNISALGPLVLVALLYEGMGIILAWLVSQIFWVPHRFRRGILVAGGWSNWGDIPTAVVMSITSAAPFNGTADQTLSVAYIAGFLLVYMITFFPMGGSRLVGLDYVGPDVEPEEVQEAARRRRRLIIVEWPTRLVGLWRSRNTPPLEEAITPEHEKPQRPRVASKHVSFDQHIPDNGSVGAISSSTPPEGWHSRLASPAPTATAVDPADVSNAADDRPATPILPTVDPHAAARSPWIARRKAIYANIRPFLRNLFMPGSVAILVSFVIALVPQLKALFVEVDGTHIHSAPDGDPPLAFFIDAASFIGAASVPMGLICLGSALARLSIPRGAWGSLPSGAILGLAVGKMLISPVLGVLICKGLINVNVISREDKVLQFVCIFFSCLPTATTQVFVTQVYSGTGSAEHLSAFLIPQYILMLPSMTALTAYTLHSLF
ncbi:Auxin efflux carrier transmembrane protein [Mycena venus]|uniref:Auxin efflux carrier transmembrane protein n=1 Tax=Mycena venus TaxID=2733690 RepID=A0A8H6Z1F5_9AGAR|nr:Auxin efflux carrier transmembrane protein [Mycena venus]